MNRQEHGERDDAPDAALIARWKQGDERAASRLVERHAQPIARFVASLGEREDVDEVVQDTFVRAFGSLDAFRGESSLRTWLFTIARRLVLDRRRADRRNREVKAVQDADAASAYDALDGLIAVESEGRIREAMGRLSPTQREVFTLRVTEGLSYKEIAEVVGTTEGAARVHYHNALRTVKEMLYV
jgi:RNA polymerase sigma-70 factor, ECF subfamily